MFGSQHMRKTKEKERKWQPKPRERMRFISPGREKESRGARVRPRAFVPVMSTIVFATVKSKERRSHRSRGWELRRAYGRDFCERGEDVANDFRLCCWRGREKTEGRGKGNGEGGEVLEWVLRGGEIGKERV